jgi:S-adenosylmethionine hydrolase
VDVKFITILTDFGLLDGFVGSMRGVMLGIAPDAQIADLSHNIAPQNVEHGAFALARTVKYYPEGTIHVVVIDPGVGTTRRPIAARIGEQYYVAPDNGVLSFLYQQAEEQGSPLEVVHLDNPKYWLEEISNVFHGRDIFAPVGAHLANGVPLNELGTPIQDFVRIPSPEVETTPDGLRGQIISIDNFGNLITNLESQHLEDFQKLRVKVRDVEIDGLVQTFGKRQVGELVALIGDADDLWISVVNGSARKRLGAQVGDVVEILVDEQ